MNIVTKSVKLKVAARIRWTLKHLAYLNPRRVNRLQVTATYDIDDGCAGYADCAASQIELNPWLLMENIDEFIRVIVPHEVAHIVDFVVNKPPRHHGKTWIRMMKSLDLPWSITHPFNVDHVPLANPDCFKYQCACVKPCLLTLREHGNRQKRVRNKPCEICGKQLKFIGLKRVTRKPK